MSEETGREAEVQEEVETETEGGITVPEDFDPARALKTIQAQREAEKRLKEEKAELLASLAKYQEGEEKEIERHKTLEQKLAERDARIAELEGAAALKEVQRDFAEKARDRGYESPNLAFLAAREAGLLGEYDPKTGIVGDHDFEALEESHAQFAAEAGRAGGSATGDAGTRGGGAGATPGGTFNKLVRGSL